jgi:hypothetical protein
VWKHDLQIERKWETQGKAFWFKGNPQTVENAPMDIKVVVL